MKVWVYQDDTQYECGEVRKVFDTKEKAEKHHTRMLELSAIRKKLREYGGPESEHEKEFKKMEIETGMDLEYYGNKIWGKIIEMEVE